MRSAPGGTSRAKRAERSATVPPPVPGHPVPAAPLGVLLDPDEGPGDRLAEGTRDAARDRTPRFRREDGIGAFGDPGLGLRGESQLEPLQAAADRERHRHRFHGQMARAGGRELVISRRDLSDLESPLRVRRRAPGPA